MPGTILRTKAIKEFVEKVSIAGLQEAFEAPFRVVRIMFKISLILAFGAIGYEMYAIITQCMDQSDSFGTLNIITDQPPFPVVTICYPGTIDENVWDEFAGPVYENEKAIRDYMNKNHLEPIDAKRFMREVMAMQASLNDIDTSKFKLTRKVFRKMDEKGHIRVGNMEMDLISRLSMIPCDLVLKNCSMNGQYFECCQEASFMFKFPFSTCYHIPATNLSTRDLLTNSDSVLLLNVSMDWTYGIFENDVASDGFEIYINTLPFFVKALPEFIPAGMDASVVLAEPKRINQITDCISNDQAPKLKYFDSYDSEGLQCLQETIVDISSQFLGCHSPVGSYIPPQTNCTFEIFFLSKLFMNLNFDANSSMGNSLQATEMKSYGMLTNIGSKDSPCKPLCTRWSYPSMSTSYSSIVDKSFEDETNTSNISWSTIKIILPYNSFMVETEQKRARWYLSVCDIGGMMGVYAGFSMITFVQVAFYGLMIILSKRMNTVQASIQPVVSLARSIAQQEAVVTTGEDNRPVAGYNGRPRAKLNRHVNASRIPVLIHGKRRSRPKKNNKDRIKESKTTEL